MKYQTISMKQFFPAKGAIYYVTIATVIFSHVKFSCVKVSCFRAKAHLVFRWCLYNKIISLKTLKLLRQTRSEVKLQNAI